MDKKHQKLCDNVLEDIQKVCNNTSVPLDVVLNSLEELREAISERVYATMQDMENDVRRL